MRSLIPLVLACLLLLGPTASTACTSDDGKLETLPTYNYNDGNSCFYPDRVTSSQRLSDNRGQARVYQLERTKVDQAYANDIADKLGISSSPIYRPGRSAGASGDSGDSGLFSAEDDAAWLVVYEDGGFISFHLKSTGESGWADQPISGDDARKTAERFLRDLNLMPRSKLRATVAQQKDGNLIDVAFEPAGIPALAGITQYGITVTLMRDGEVWGFTYEWPEPHDIGKYPIISESEALERLRRCQAYIVDHDYGMDVTSIELVYLGVPLWGPYEYLIPAYYLTDSPEDKLFRQVALVPAVTDEYIQVNPPEMTPSPEP